MGLRIGFHYHIPATVSGNGKVVMPGYLSRFVDSLAERCSQVICFQHDPRPNEVQLCDTEVRNPNVALVSLGPRHSVPRRALQASRIVGPIVRARDRLDVMLVRGPSPLLPAVARAGRPLPTALLLVGDNVIGVNDLPQPRWRKELIRLWSLWNRRQQDSVARRALTFVNSRQLYRRYSGIAMELVETRTTTLSESDFQVRADPCLGRPMRLLYVGRFDRGKGLLDILEALRILKVMGIEAVLDLVGWPQEGDDVLEELYERSTSYGIRDAVVDQGYRKVGPDLLEMYYSADVFLIASRSAEGFPRTIWEAMASCIPVVSTSVGSIPDFLEDRRSAMLVPPEEPERMAKAIVELSKDADLRRRLIGEGLKLAQENTLERRSIDLVSTLEAFVQGS